MREATGLTRLHYAEGKGGKETGCGRGKAENIGGGGGTEVLPPTSVAAALPRSHWLAAPTSDDRHEVQLALLALTADYSRATSAGKWLAPARA